MPTAPAQPSRTRAPTSPPTPAAPVLAAPAAPPSTPQHPTVPGSVAKIINGVAYAPAYAPMQVQQAIWAGNQIRLKPYAVGGGHGKWKDSAYDCSGSVSYVLHAAGLLKISEDSGEMESWGSQGPRAVDHRLHQPRPRLRRDRRDPPGHLARGRSAPGARHRPALAPGHGQHRGLHGPSPVGPLSSRRLGGQRRPADLVQRSAGRRCVQASSLALAQRFVGSRASVPPRAAPPGRDER